ncbi:hypothetical protein PRIC1_006748 [Phytophthora ramorum]|nr:hypothetical protein KRP22_3746 [Phytophthora ramorum]
MGCSQSKASEVVIEPTTAPPSECGKASMDLAFTEIIVDQDESSTSVPPASVEEEADVEEETVIEEEIIAAPVVEVEDPVVEEPLVEEPVVEAEEPTVEEEEVEEDPVEPEVEAEEEVELQEKSAVVEKSTVTSVSSPTWTFEAEAVKFTVGIAFFNIIGSNTEGADVHLTKRYSEFKLLHAEMAKLMDREELPRMPVASFLQGRNDKALLQERETVFVKMLNAIAVHPEGSQSAEFNAFLA